MQVEAKEDIAGGKTPRTGTKQASQLWPPGQGTESAKATPAQRVALKVHNRSCWQAPVGNPRCSDLAEVKSMMSAWGGGGIGL